jgi:hypothetical protein
MDAFSYPETIGCCEPRFSCYGQPHVTDERVAQSDASIGSGRFEGCRGAT